MESHRPVHGHTICNSKQNLEDAFTIFEITYFLGHNVIVSSLSIAMLLQIQIFARHKLGMHTKLQKIRNKAVEFTDRLFHCGEGDFILS